MDEQQIIALERKIEELIKLCETLYSENHSLKSKESNWLLERARLIEKNELARSKIEAMIIRLKSMEQTA